MSYGVALRNGIPFTLGTIAALCVNATGQAWSPLALWPTGTEPGMWIDPSNLTSQWQDSAGTTPVSTPGTVADSSNPVGLALDLRLGATALADPGNHLLQATSTARPLVSARRNLLTYTEDFVHWWSGGIDVSSNTTTAPDGTITADTLIASASPGEHRAYQAVSGQRGDGVFSVYLKAKEYGFAFVAIAESNATLYKGALVDLSNGAVVSNSANVVNVVDAGSGWYRISVQETAIDLDYFVLVSPAPSADVTIGAFGPVFTGDGTSGIYAWGAQLERGTGPTPNTYQAILTDGSSYPSTGFPIYQKYDGTDDGMATATFAAGTLSNAMDCMIAVRRDSAVLPSVCGLYQVDQTKYFGVVGEEPSNSAGTFGNCGSPSIFVDGVSVANTRGALHSAIGVGDWHILEYRDLDLSAWVNAGFGSYGNPYTLNGAQGGILLFPSSTSTADRDAARTWLGAKVGLTL